MRLRDYEVNAIKEAVFNMDKDAVVYLFGSRVDDNKKGGDIDILILSELLNQGDASYIRDKVCDSIGEQKIDILIEKDLLSSFVKIIMKEAIML